LKTGWWWRISQQQCENSEMEGVYFSPLIYKDIVYVTPFIRMAKENKSPIEFQFYTLLPFVTGSYGRMSHLPV